MVVKADAFHVMQINKCLWGDSYMAEGIAEWNLINNWPTFSLYYVCLFETWKGKDRKNQKIIALQHTLQTFGLLMVQLDMSGLEITDGIISSEYIDI